MALGGVLSSAMRTEAIEKYRGEVEKLKGESARSHRFAQLLQELFGREPGFIEQYVQGIEQVVRARQKDRLLRGQVDNLFGNLVIEFEASLDRKRKEAEEQLRGYVHLLWSQEQGTTKTPYLCLATDGIRFATYTPVPTDGSEAVQLQPLEEIDFSTGSAEELYLWLDRMLVRQEKLTPTSELIVREFGLRSHAYCTLSHRLMQTWQALREEPPYAVLYNTWERYLHIVYGALSVEPELFIRHTYLATLAKMMAWQRLRNTPLNPQEMLDLINGKLFQREGILGYIEDDFFAWLARPEAQHAGIEMMRYLFSLMASYDFKRLTEDVLKSLYQELVDPATRHDLGEYYTPDWLAHKMVQQLLESEPRRSLFDPACGSGTFVYFALLEKRRRLGDNPETLQHVLQSVCGADIHPLAVIIARTNYLLGLGELLRYRASILSIPIYLADTLRLPEYEHLEILGQPTYRYLIELDGKHLYLPESFLRDPTRYDRIVDLACEFAETIKGKPFESAHLRGFLQARQTEWRELQEEFEAFQTLVLSLKHFLEEGRDTIWAFILKNLYKPLLLKERFDVLMGNPPWIAFRSLEPRYQAFIRRLIVGDYGLVKGRGELITHLEIAALFLLRTADLYLKPGGTIAFVMPRSLFHADQHDGLRRGDYRFAEHPKATLRFVELWDCEQVNPLFTVPCCVVWARKQRRLRRARTALPAEIRMTPLPARIFAGKLPAKNIALQEAQQYLTETATTLYLHTHERRSYWSEKVPSPSGQVSPYRERFREGATIVPRNFWFVQIPRSWMGIDPVLPPIKTYSPRSKYKISRDTGQIEARFLYATLLGDDVFPFGYRNPRMVALPILPSGSEYELLDAEQLYKRGYFKMWRWIEYLESEWTRLRGSKAKQTVIEWLNYRNKLTSQNPQARYLVLYPDIQRISFALVVEPQQVVNELIQREQGVNISGFVVESVLYFCETDEADEAFYLAAVLNAPEIDRRLGGLRRKEQKSHPHVAKKIFDVAPIPLYDASNEVHRRLAELGKLCTHRVQAALAAGQIDIQQNITALRRSVRDLLAEPLEQIDRLVQNLLAGG
jgi:hypothetical protein